MKRIPTFLIILLTFVYGCKDKTQNAPVQSTFVQMTISENNVTPTVDIKNFVLISDNVEAELGDAKEIMKVKRNFPLAMQTKNETLFNAILAKY